jgi:uncharacterized protein
LESSQVPEPPPVTPSAAEQVSPTPAPAEDPAWTTADAILLTLVIIAALAFSMIATTLVAQRWYFHAGTFMSVFVKPMVGIVAQVGAYLLFLAVAYVFVRWERHRPFLAALSWNWPRDWYWAFLAAGVVLSVGLELILRFLPTPKTLPVNELFKTPAQALFLSIFSVSLGPLVEEFFFRGFWYPALARRLGRASSVVLTAIPFALIHSAQLANAWGPVLIIFIVGLVLGTVRAITRSLASSLLVHVAYNSTISVLIYIGTDGYRHLEKLTQ